MAKSAQGNNASQPPGWDEAGRSQLFGMELFTDFMLSTNPQVLMQQNMELAQRLAAIAMGSSDIAADPRDWRFKDKAWSTNPYYKRLAQTYLALTEAVEQLIPEDLNLESKARAQLVASIVTSSLSPTNTLMGNPAALARTVETGGGNLVNGFNAFLTDLFERGGMPQQVDDSKFEVGVNLAVTPGKIVLKTDLFELIHYKPATEQVRAIPVLLIPPQIGRFYFTDLAPGRSFAEYAVSQGLQYFAISWRNPSGEDSDLDLEAYAKAALQALEIVTSITGQKQANIVGFCAGGILSAIIAAYLAGEGRKLINAFTLCVAMLDFKTDAAMGAFRLPTLLTVAKARSELNGVLAGTDLHKLFSWLRPNDLIWNYWVNNYLMGDTPAPFDILAWNNDSTNLAGPLHHDFLQLFETNCLIESGGYELNGRPLNLGDIDCDMFVVGAQTDHLTPWKACYQSQTHIGGEKTFVLSNGGHIAALVNPPGNPKANHWIAPATADGPDAWLEHAQKLPGSWWESWAKWCAARSGELVPAPKQLGSKAYPPTVDAPGEYVRS